MEFLKLLSSVSDEKRNERREVYLSDKFYEYQEMLKKIRKMEFKIIKLEESIFGTAGNIKVGYACMVNPPYMFDYTNFGRFVIDPINKKFYRKEFKYSEYYNGKMIKNDRIETTEYDFKDSCMDSTDVLLAIRILSSRDLVKQCRAWKKWRVEKNKEMLAKDPTFYRQHPYHEMSLGNWQSQYYKTVPNSTNKFIFKLISNASFISYYIKEYGFEKDVPRDQLYKVYTDFISSKNDEYDAPNEVLKVFLDDDMFGNYKNGANFYNAYTVISRIKKIKAQVRAKYLKKAVKYNEVRLEYEKIRDEIIEIESYISW